MTEVPKRAFYVQIAADDFDLKRLGDKFVQFGLDLMNGKIEPSPAESSGDKHGTFAYMFRRDPDMTFERFEKEVQGLIDLTALPTEGKPN